MFPWTKALSFNTQAEGQGSQRQAITYKQYPFSEQEQQEAKVKVKETDPTCSQIWTFPVTIQRIFMFSTGFMLKIQRILDHQQGLIKKIAHWVAYQQNPHLMSHFFPVDIYHNPAGWQFEEFGLEHRKEPLALDSWRKEWIIPTYSVFPTKTWFSSFDCKSSSFSCFHVLLYFWQIWLPAS